MIITDEMMRAQDARLATRLSELSKAIAAKNERERVLEDRVCELQSALRDLVMLERVQAPDMGSKPRTYAFMQNGKVLAEVLDRARTVLGKTV